MRNSGNKKRTWVAKRVLGWQRYGRSCWKWFATFWTAMWHRVLGSGFLVVSFVSAQYCQFGHWLRWCNRGYLLRGLPAFLLAVSIVLLAAFIGLEDPQRCWAFYQQTGARAFIARDYATAALAYERLALFNENALEPRYAWARAANGLGQTAVVDLLLESLAPAKARGYPPAQMWQAQRLLAGQPDGPRLKAAEGHLRWVLLAEPDLVEAHAVLGQVCLVTKRPVEALEHLLRALPTQPELELPVAGLYAQLGKPDQAVTHARRAQDFYRPLAEKTGDDPLPRLRWAEATMVAGDPKAAAAILQAGLAEMHPAAYRKALAQVFLAWSDAVGRDKPADLGARLELLEQALRYEPGAVAVLARLLELSLGKDQDAATAKTLLNKQLTNGKSPGTVHLLLGMQARAQGAVADARFHFEQAYRLQPDLALAANNLAWALAHGEPPDLPQALKLIDSVLERWPQEARFRDTRGQILAKQGRWQEAITDLEVALPHMQNNAALHATLAQAYRQVGFPDLAREHEKWAVPPAAPTTTRQP